MFLKIFVNRDFGTYTIKLFADGVKVDERIEQLSRTPKEIFENPTNERLKTFLSNINMLESADNYII